MDEDELIYREMNPEDDFYMGDKVQNNKKNRNSTGRISQDITCEEDE